MITARNPENQETVDYVGQIAFAFQRLQTIIGDCEDKFTIEDFIQIAFDTLVTESGIDLQDLMLEGQKAIESLKEMIENGLPEGS